MDIPATSDNIPGTLVLRDAAGLTSCFQVNANYFVATSNSPEGGQISLLDASGSGGWEIDNVGTGPSATLRIFRDKNVNNVYAVGITSTGCVRVGSFEPDAAAQLEVSSTTRGFLPPRMTEAERDAITSPPAGLMLYNSTTNKLQVRTDTAWVDLH